MKMYVLFIASHSSILIRVHTSTMATSSPLVARSTDGSLIAIHPQDNTSSTSNKTGLVRCYDGNISNGSLKFTLRFPLTSSSQENDDGVPTSALEKKDGLHKLLFASTSYLCGMKQSSSSILIWDLHRGVLASTIDIHNSATDKKKKKKQRKSSLVATGNEVLCDVATKENQLYALIYFPNNNDNESGGGKCRLYQYNLSSEGSTLVRKIKVGSYSGSSGEGESSQQQQPVFGIGISESTIVVRLGNNHVRIIDIVSGDKLCKLDIPSDGKQSGGEEVVPGSTLFAPLSVSRDGSYIVTSMNGSQAVVLSYAKGNDDDDTNTKHSLQTLAILSSNKADDSPITSLDITHDTSKDELSVVAFQSTVGISSLFNISTTSTSTSMVPQLPQATLQTNENDKLVSFIGSSFSSRTPNESLLLLFTQAKHAGGSAAGSGTNLPMELVSYDSLEGKVIVGTSLVEGSDGGKDKKRKAVTTALAPGDQGQESSLASDLMMGGGGGKKKARVSFGGVEAKEGEEGEKEVGGEKDKVGDDFFLDADMSDDDEDGEQSQSIAERLALLSSAMEETDDEDEDDDDDDDDDEEDQTSSKPKKKEFQLKSATSETLTTLLTQALSSNDSSQLNIALQVTDRRLVDGTVRALQSLDAERAANQADDDGDTKVASTGSVGYIPTLMAHIVRRMARRHSLVMTLGVWVKAILAATARSSSHQLLNEEMNAVEEQMAKDGKALAGKLGPLKNFLNERVESFPQLLRLEGRLSLLNQQL